VKRLLGLIGIMLGLAPWVRALEFARPFGEFMVLPHGVAVPVWGRAEPGVLVRVSFGQQHPSARCGADGTWRVTLAAEPPAAIGRELSAATDGTTVVLRDVLVGEVWLYSGQSNMDFPLANAVGGKAEAAAAGRHPGIRLLNLTGAPTAAGSYDAATLARLTVDRHFQGQWAVASASSAAAISAVAWWTAKALHAAKGIPIGVVENAVGGSGAEAWLPRETLESRADYQPLLGDGWLDCEKIGAWARGRASQNLGGRREAMHPFRPGFLFESGVRAWSGFPFAGVLWYQGETNAEVADDAWNERLIADLVGGWRTALKQPALPFFMVQLPRIGGNDPLRAHWPQFREVQARAAKRLPGVRLVVTQDLGWDSPNVHPPDKRPVAERLAAAILAPP
jgi:sialate O-acetylesterase